MICEKILGTVDTLDLKGKKLEYVDIEWHEAFKKDSQEENRDGQGDWQSAWMNPY